MTTNQDAVLDVLRELRGKTEIVRAAQTPQEARAHLEGFVSTRPFTTALHPIWRLSTCEMCCM